MVIACSMHNVYAICNGKAKPLFQSKMISKDYINFIALADKMTNKTVRIYSRNACKGDSTILYSEDIVVKY